MNGSWIEGYRAFLVRRDGDCRFCCICLGAREDFSQRGAHPVRSTLPFDRQVFLRNLAAVDPNGCRTQDLFLLATAKL